MAASPRTACAPAVGAGARRGGSARPDRKIPPHPNPCWPRDRPASLISFFMPAPSRQTRGRPSGLRSSFDPGRHLRGVHAPDVDGVRWVVDVALRESSEARRGAGVSASWWGRRRGSTPRACGLQAESAPLASCARNRPCSPGPAQKAGIKKPPPYPTQPCPLNHTHTHTPFQRCSLKRWPGSCQRH